MHGLQMYYELTPVSSCGERQALVEFAAWLNKFSSPLIVAHNAQFDARILVSCFSRHGLIDLVKKVVGFSDTVKLFKKVYPDQQSYKLQDLVKSFAPDFESSNAHNAEHDVSMLKNLVTNKPNMEESLRDAVFSTEYVIANNEKLSNKNRNIGSFTDLITSNILTKSQSSTLAAYGLQSNHLKFALERGGREGLLTVLKGKLKSFNSVIDKVIAFYNV